MSSRKLSASFFVQSHGRHIGALKKSYQQLFSSNSVINLISGKERAFIDLKVNLILFQLNFVMSVYFDL